MNSRAVGILIVSCIVFITCASAQEIIVNGPAWVDGAELKGDTLPKLDIKDRPAYNDTQRPSDQLGYAYFTAVLSAWGDLQELKRLYSYPYFSDVAGRWAANLKFQPARNNGKRSGAFVWFSVLFNPESAAPTGPDATPRLLAVAPAIVSSADLGEFGQAGGLVWLRFVVDTDGSIHEVKFDDPATEKFRGPVETALKAWKFAPARAGGQPRSVELHLPIPVHDNVARTLPRVSYRVQPDVPDAIKDKRKGAEVDLVFDVSPKGRATNIKVESSTTPEFNSIAIATLQKWDFEPGTENGKVATVAMKWPIYFGTNVVNIETGDLHWSVDYKAKAATPLHAITPVYPYSLLRDRVSGSAEIRYRVNGEGRVDGDDVVSSSNPEFAGALAAAVEATPFTRPTGSREQSTVWPTEKFEFKFRAEGRDGVPRPSDLAMLEREKNHPETILSAKRLDAPLKPTSREAPRFPFSAIGRLEQGEAVVEIIIDEAGNACLPRVVRASDPALGYAATQAAAAWKFDPPLAQGKPVASRVQIPFKFKHENLETAAKPAAATAKE